MVLISGSILVLMWILGHDYSGHYNRLTLISVDIIGGVYCSTKLLQDIRAICYCCHCNALIAGPIKGCLRGEHCIIT